MPRKTRKNPNVPSWARKAFEHGRLAGMQGSPALTSFLSENYRHWYKQGYVEGKRWLAKNRVRKNPSRKNALPMTDVVKALNAAHKRHKRKKNRAPPSFIHIQKHGKGPVLTYTETGTFSTPQTGVRFHRFASQDAAHQKATRLMAQFPVLDTYKIWISQGGKARRANPSQRDKLDTAAQKLENFTGHEATHVERVSSRSDEKTGLVIGEVDLIGYRATRDGKAERYGHTFRKRSRPLLAVSTDGKQLHIVGGQYEFTEAGIEDR